MAGESVDWFDLMSEITCLHRDSLNLAFAVLTASPAKEIIEQDELAFLKCDLMKFGDEICSTQDARKIASHIV